MSDKVTTIQDLKDIQSSTEGTYWAQMPELEDVRHTILHANKMFGLWSTLIEVYEHSKLNDPPIPEPHPTELMRKKLVANMLIWVLHYANMYGYDMSELYRWKIELNKRRTDAAMRSSNVT